MKPTGDLKRISFFILLRKSDLLVIHPTFKMHLMEIVNLRLCNYRPFISLCKRHLLLEVNIRFDVVLLSNIAAMHM